LPRFRVIRSLPVLAVFFPRSTRVLLAPLAIVFSIAQARGQAPVVTFSGGQVPVVSTGLSSPGGIAVDGSGNVYIADTNNNRVLKETLSGGVYTQSIVGSGLETPSDVSIDYFGDVYIADTGHNQIVLEAPSGSTVVVTATDTVTGAHSSTNVTLNVQ
jgi:hypothetical protein